MPTKTKTRPAADRSPGERAARSNSTGAIDLLKRDHREVEGYFKRYEGLKDGAAKAALAEKICRSLRVHTQIEEEIFYPQAREATGDEKLLDEALVEHAGAKTLIAEIELMEVGDDLYDAKVQVLGEQIKHHVQEEEKELFPEVESSELDLAAIGEELAARKDELFSERAASRK